MSESKEIDKVDERIGLFGFFKDSYGRTRYGYLEEVHFPGQYMIDDGSWWSEFTPGLPPERIEV